MSDATIVRSILVEREGAYHVVSVRISALCPVCGGPRREAEPGWRYVVDSMGRDSELWADEWVNPCGHEDTYPACFTEYQNIRLGEACLDPDRFAPWLPESAVVLEHHQESMPDSDGPYWEWVTVARYQCRGCGKTTSRTVRHISLGDPVVCDDPTCGCLFRLPIREGDVLTGKRVTR